MHQLASTYTGISTVSATHFCCSTNHFPNCVGSYDARDTRTAEISYPEPDEEPEAQPQAHLAYTQEAHVDLTGDDPTSFDFTVEGSTESLKQSKYQTTTQTPGRSPADCQVRAPFFGD